MLRIELPEAPAYPPALPASFLDADGPEPLNGAAVEFVAGERCFPGTVWLVRQFEGRARSVRVALGRAPFEDVAGAIAAAWGPPQIASKTRSAWLAPPAAPAFRVYVRKDHPDVFVMFGPVQPLARYFDVLDAALRGEDVLPRAGRSRSENDAALAGSLVTGHLTTYRVAPPLVYGEFPMCATVEYDASDRARVVYWNGGAGALDGAKVIERAVTAFWQRHGGVITPKRTGRLATPDGAELEIWNTVKPAGGSLIAVFRRP